VSVRERDAEVFVELGAQCRVRSREHGGDVGKLLNERARVRGAHGLVRAQLGERPFGRCSFGLHLAGPGGDDRRVCAAPERGRGPASYRVGRHIRHRQSDIEQRLEAQSDPA
jgi:hypothetical protein